ncbi:hypothetical protein [Actinomyces culturomici]|uniref:hypothetical protein n=1 Tax=Actinomyces culturomici TaxID=1926276 RepID=UPI00135C1FFB|nr:hypothetical protein [Actinomyces culturomici]
MQQTLEEVPLLKDAASALGNRGPEIRVRCPKCGFLETEDARFCSSCAAPLGPGASPSV